MSDVTPAPTTPDAPKPRKPVPMTRVISAVAKAKGIEDAAAGKRVRAYIRSHKGELAKSWKHLDKRSKGDTYADVPPTVAKAIVAALTKRA